MKQKLTCLRNYPCLNGKRKLLIWPVQITIKRLRNCRQTLPAWKKILKLKGNCCQPIFCYLFVFLHSHKNDGVIFQGENSRKPHDTEGT